MSATYINNDKYRHGWTMVQVDMMTICSFLFCYQYQSVFDFVILRYYDMTNNSPALFPAQRLLCLVVIFFIWDVLHNVIFHGCGILFVDSTWFNSLYQWSCIGTYFIKENLVHLVKVFNWCGFIYKLNDDPVYKLS